MTREQALERIVELVKLQWPEDSADECVSYAHALVSALQPPAGSDETEGWYIYLRSLRHQTLEHGRLAAITLKKGIEAAWAGHDWDGGDIQDTCLDAGILIEDRATEEDCSAGFDGDPGDPIYRYSEWFESLAKDPDQTP